MLRHILIAEPVEGHFTFYLTSTEDPTDYGETVEFVRKRFSSCPTETSFRQWRPYGDYLNMFVAFNLNDEEYRRIFSGGLEIGFSTDDGDWIPEIVSRVKLQGFTKIVVVGERSMKRDNFLRVMNVPI